jgi:hypothetical protein
MGAIADALDEVIASFSVLSLPVVDDPRKARPGSVLVEPPSGTGITASISEITIPVTILTLPPGTPATIRQMLDVADEIFALWPAADMTPGIWSSGGQDLPCYTLTLRITIRR